MQLSEQVILTIYNHSENRVKVGINKVCNWNFKCINPLKNSCLNDSFNEIIHVNEIIHFNEKFFYNHKVTADISVTRDIRPTYIISYSYFINKL